MRRGSELMCATRPAATLTNLYSIEDGGDLGTATPQGEILLQPGQFIEPEVTGVAQAK